MIRRTLAAIFTGVGNVRFSERARRKFVWLWTWGADRHAGRAGALQDAFYARHGSAGLARRIERVLRALGARHA